jgi:hypothetical protein
MPLCAAVTEAFVALTMPPVNVAIWARRMPGPSSPVIVP